MYIKDCYGEGKTALSLEVFPPKKESSLETVLDVLERVTATDPSFVSVTYGASGNLERTKYSQMLATLIKNQYDTEPLFHLTCVNSQKAWVEELLGKLAKNNIHNILALQGDLPKDYALENRDFQYALDLIAVIRDYGGFCIGAACYPEGHIAEEREENGYEVLVKKQEAGADFFISQLFFENRHFLVFRDKARVAGVTKPLVAGIMPVLSKSQINNMIFMCGTSLPGAVVKMLHKYGEDGEALKAAGMEYAFRQAEDLIREGVDGIHLYTMNQPAIAEKGMERLRNRHGK